MSNEETPTTEQPRALALAMRAGGRQEGRTEEGRPQGRREEEGRCEEGRRTEEGGGPQEERRSQEGCCCRGSGRGLDAVGQFRSHELSL